MVRFATRRPIPERRIAVRSAPRIATQLVTLRPATPRRTPGCHVAIRNTPRLFPARCAAARLVMVTAPRLIAAREEAVGETGGHTETLSRISANFLSPMPGTSFNWSTLWKPP
ncbi:hypothetical protein GCM10010116_14780 [Microbispora rosea subsp. aerata]|nr:hypothetical protein GCM10010116_14780 [Microbispora rosea subsp. aerata]GIH53178.1 hypothetical protein Mro02_00920 [Microbispora rosea subsp. aerata]GLJ83910.1 hypothetical protein GCM10017588_26380 [Microbispora rosea subsp. aerata]